MQFPKLNADNQRYAKGIVQRGTSLPLTFQRSMEPLDKCQRHVLETIYLNGPSVKHFLTTIHKYAELFGRSFSDDEINQALSELVATGHVIEITPSVADSIRAKLSGVCCPTEQFHHYPYFSVTEKGGKQRKRYLEETGRTERPYFPCGVAKHVQCFTPSTEVATRLLSTPGAVGDKVEVGGVFLAENNESASGYLVDLILRHAESLRLLEVIGEIRDALSDDILQRARQKAPQILHQLQLVDIRQLIALSGHLGSPRYASVRRLENSNLANSGLITKLDKEHARLSIERFKQFRGVMFASKPQREDLVVSHAGGKALSQWLRDASELQNHLVATRTTGEFIQYYCSDMDSADQVQAKLSEKGCMVSSIDRIGPWCQSWWDVHSEGIRVSCWVDSRIDGWLI